MTPLVARIVFLLMTVGWFVIRFPHARRSGRVPVSVNRRGPLERALLAISLTGLGILPILYAATGVPAIFDRPFVPWLAWLGVATAIAALLLFRLTHKALGRMWSVSLELREDHRLVADGIYRRVRHPMYSAFWLWAIAQALLLPNWLAGLSGIAGFGALYLFRVGREERMMEERFGDAYRTYAARTARLIPFVH